MKNMIKKISLSLFVLIILFSINTKVYAWTAIISEGRDFVSAGETSKQGDIVVGDLQETSGFLYNILLSAGIVVAVVVATVLGVQFMIGGAEGQAKVKEMIVPFVVGCIVVFGGFGLWKLAISVGKKIETADLNPNIIVQVGYEYKK